MAFVVAGFSKVYVGEIVEKGKIIFIAIAIKGIHV
jgi:hypothetical protein